MLAISPLCTTTSGSLDESGRDVLSVCLEKLSRWTPLQRHRSFRLDSMATVVAVAQGEPLQSLEMAPLKIPERVHVADHDSEERASPIQKMSSVPRFRFRAVKEQPTATLGGNEESPTSSGGTLPPDSIGNLPQSQGISYNDTISKSI